ncbi:MAG: hypothetical protein PHU14_12780, partial [Methylovulum sp.]|nr:hypothetical protein [Methylovulum sp.]
MAYSEIADSEIDQDSPITTGLMTKLRNNPLFIGDQQTFTSSGTWTKPTATSRGQYAYVQVWGAGGGGGTTSNGGGGGSYKEAILLVSALASTVTVTIVAGGASATNGGFSSFGAHVKAYGGSGGVAGGRGGSGGGVNATSAAGGGFNDLSDDAVKTEGSGNV